MWRVANGERYFHSAFGFLLANGLLSLLLANLDARQKDGDYELGIDAFDILTPEQKIVVLRKVGFALLDKKTPTCDLNAVTESAVAAIFCEIDRNLVDEINENRPISFELSRRAKQKNTEKDIQSDEFQKWQRMILAAWQEEFPDRRESIFLTKSTLNDWRCALGDLSEQILWGLNYSLDFVNDLSPQTTEAHQQLFGIEAEYFSCIPNDPKPMEAERLESEAITLCDDFFKRWEAKH